VFKILVDLVADLLVDLHIEVDRDRLVSRDLHRWRTRDRRQCESRSSCDAYRPSLQRIRHCQLRCLFLQRDRSGPGSIKPCPVRGLRQSPVHWRSPPPLPGCMPVTALMSPLCAREFTNFASSLSMLMFSWNACPFITAGLRPSMSR